MKKEKTKQFDYKKLIYIYFILLPIIDVITSIMTRFMENSISLGTIIKGLTLIFIVIYNVFFTKSEYKKITITYYFIIGFYIIFNILSKLSYLTLPIAINDAKFGIKYSYMIFMLPGLINLFKDLKMDNKDMKKIMEINIITYIVLLLLPLITNTGFDSYDGGIMKGSTGWFYSANEISAILLSLLAIMIDELETKKAIYIYIIVILMTLIGTKTSLLGMVILFILMLIYGFKEKKIKHKLITPLVLLICVAVSLFASPVKENVGNLIITENESHNIVEEVDYKYKSIDDVVDNELLAQIIRTALSGRDEFLLTNYSIYSESSLKDKLFGLGFSNREDIGYIAHRKTIEMDFCDIWIHYGIVGLIVYLLPFIYILREIILKRKYVKPRARYYLLVSGLLLAISFLTGHIMSAPASAIYFVLVVILSCNEIKEQKSSSIIPNKITFLLLHLGYGGIESSTINTANALSSKYDIELISLYNLEKNQTNKINDKVKVKFLYNGSPNKEEFKQALKEKKIINIIKEGFKALSILRKRRNYIIREIRNCDSKYIVSTRYDFSAYLSRYSSDYNITIAQEHHYHNNNRKYINVLKRKYMRIDYLFALTSSLKKCYEDFLKNNKHTKVVLMPNMLVDYPKEQSKLNTNNLITVSRFDYLKRNDQIIKAFKEIDSKNAKLYIIGDGKEYQNLENQIKELNLEGKAILTGYKSKEEIEKYMLDSSIFLMASETEGLPMVLLEAMSFGIPCIAFNLPSGISDIIEDNKNGYIIENRNEEEYVDKINKLLKDKKLLSQMGEEAKKKSQEFSKEKITKEWIKILNN